MTAINISRDLTLETDGTVSGLDCGLRASGVTVARQGDAAKVHFFPPARMAFAPALYDLVAGLIDVTAVRTTSDGRIVADPRLADVTMILAKLDVACGEERGRGGIPDGTHGVYDIKQARDGWHYLVTTAPSGRASLKKIATWTGESGKFKVPYSEGAALAGILERAVTARIKGQTTTIRLPEVSGVTVSIEGGEILVCPDRRDNEVLREVPSLRWDPKRSAYAVSTRYSKHLAKALEEVKGRVEERALKEAEAQAALQSEADRIEADAPRIRTLMAEALAGFSIVRLRGRVAHLRFAYNEDSINLARGLPRARYDKISRTWITGAKTDADVAAIVAAVKTIQDRADAADAASASERQDRAAKAEADRIEAAERKAAEGIGSYLEYEYRAPAVGTVVTVAGRACVVTSLGRTFVADEDTSSMGGPIGAEGERLCAVHYRAATDEEAAPLMAKAAAREDRAAAIRAVAAMVSRILRDGEMPALGREPEGEVLVSDDRDAHVGYRTWMVLDAEGGLWAMTYDGGDGAAWGTYNCGYNTRGSRLKLTLAEITEFRDIIHRSRE